MEEWPRGLRRRFAKPLGSRLRGFESHLLRRDWGGWILKSPKTPERPNPSAPPLFMGEEFDLEGEMTLRVTQRRPNGEPAVMVDETGEEVLQIFSDPEPPMTLPTI